MRKAPHSGPVAAPKSLIENPDYWRERAEEARTRADLFSDERSRKIMLDIADSYDQLAERAEQRVQKLRR